MNFQSIVAGQKLPVFLNIKKMPKIDIFISDSHPT